ncbi:MAG TPA: sigma 54-interacting transcriptional regulator, partial [Silvibacterium sp.]|nr:sigma 54-interacting transcriptional regulator [Silvibacterium sp.]
MSYPVVLVHSDDPACRAVQTETGPLTVVLHELGGDSVPLSRTAQMSVSPRAAILEAAYWPQWAEALQTLRGRWRNTPLVGIFEEDAIGHEPLRNALSQGLDDFICTPVRLSELLARLDRLLKQSPTPSTKPAIQAFKLHHQLENLLGESEIFTEVLRRIPLLAAVDATVLITGETGTGKELVARALHYSGHRRNGPFVPCNCGALPDHLLENELFGHVPGAYTDARTEQKGLLAIANGGTLLLDEIEGLSLNGQVKLLRLLQDREYRPLGSAQTHYADIRIMAATNVKLPELLKQKLFREDLFHRLNVLQLNLPPLRERTGDVAGLALAFLHRFRTQMSRPALKFSDEAFNALLSHTWPGNVRELESVVQRAVVLATSNRIELADLELPMSEGPTVPGTKFGSAKRQAINGFEREYLLRLLEESDGNISRAAKKA